MPSATPETLLPLPRPLTIGETLDAALRLFRVSLPRCLPIALLSVVVGQLPTALDFARGLSAIGILRKDFRWWLVAVISGLVNLVLWNALLRRQYATATGNKTTMRSDLSAGIHAAPATFVLLVFYFAAVALGTLLLIVPGLYLSIALSFCSVAIVVNSERITQSIATSLRLTRGAWWRTSSIFGVMMVMVAVMYAFAGFVGLMLAQFARGDSAVFGAVTAIAVALIGALLMPLTSAVLLVQYAELQVRRLGGDLAARIDGAPRISTTG